MKKDPFESSRSYNLTKESLAAAAAGMFPFSNLDERCITFTIHLPDAKQHEILCRVLFDVCETYFTNEGKKQRSASFCGLASFLDINGSKFSGADRDPYQVHCHGLILIPCNVSAHQISQLVNELKLAALGRTEDGKGLTKTAPNAIKFTPFVRDFNGATLLDWIAYAQKEEARTVEIGNLGVFLPFDIRSQYGIGIEGKIEKKRNVVLATLRGPDSFKIYRTSKKSNNRSDSPLR